MDKMDNTNTIDTIDTINTANTIDTTDIIDNEVKKKKVTFILSSVTFFQIYIPLFKIYNQKGYQIQMVIRKNLGKPYADPVLREKSYQKIIEKHQITKIGIDQWYREGGLTYCVDGDMYGCKYLNYIESLIFGILSDLTPKDRKRFLVISLVENTNYVWAYPYYFKLVDYIVIMDKSYLVSYYKYQINNYLNYKEIPEINQIGHNVYLRDRQINKFSKYILDKINKMKPYPSKSLSQSIIDNILKKQISSEKNLFLGNTKYDFEISRELIFKKYKISDYYQEHSQKDKIVVIFHPEYRIKIGLQKFGKIFQKFYRDIHQWFRELGYLVVVKDRLKDDTVRREKLGDLHIDNFGYFPNPSIELLMIADFAVFFSSSVIEEVFYTDTCMVDVVIDDIDRMEFLRNDMYGYIIKNQLPDKETFTNKIKQIEEDKKNHKYDNQINEIKIKYLKYQPGESSYNIYQKVEELELKFGLDVL